MIGKTLAHYQITEKLGAGGMGEVYRALDTRLQRNVAVKVFRSKVSPDDRVWAELDALESVEVDCVPTLRDYGPIEELRAAAKTPEVDEEDAEGEEEEAA